MADKFNNLSKLTGRLDSHKMGRGRERRFVRQSWQVQATIQPNDKLRLKNNFKAELEYFNSIIEAFSARFFNSPDLFVRLTPDHEYLFGELAYHGIDIRDLEKLRRLNQMPKSFNNIEKLLDNKAAIDETIRILFECTRIPVAIHSDTKKNMAIELLKQFINSAKTRKVSHFSSEDSYRAPFTVLSKNDILQKRHVQLTKDLVKMKWNEKEGRTEISNPYTSVPIYIDQLDLTERTDWNIAIIHQESGVLATKDTPWIITFKKSNENYLIRYLDLTNPNSKSSYHKAKSGRF